jgi:hypothetical protein
MRIGMASLRPATTDDFMHDAPAAPPRETGHGGDVDEEDWPTTQRFSRRRGEAFRGADYAAAIEVSARPGARDTAIAIVVLIGALLGALVTILWRG